MKRKASSQSDSLTKSTKSSTSLRQMSTSVSQPVQKIRYKDPPKIKPRWKKSKQDPSSSQESSEKNSSSSKEKRQKLDIDQQSFGLNDQLQEEELSPDQQQRNESNHSLSASILTKCYLFQKKWRPYCLEFHVKNSTDIELQANGPMPADGHLFNQLKSKLLSDVLEVFREEGITNCLLAKVDPRETETITLFFVLTKKDNLHSVLHVKGLLKNMGFDESLYSLNYSNDIREHDEDNIQNENDQFTDQEQYDTEEAEKEKEDISTENNNTITTGTGLLSQEEKNATILRKKLTNLYKSSPVSLEFSTAVELMTDIKKFQLLMDESISVSDPTLRSTNSELVFDVWRSLSRRYKSLEDAYVVPLLQMGTRSNSNLIALLSQNKLTPETEYANSLMTSRTDFLFSKCDGCGASIHRQSSNYTVWKITNREATSILSNTLDTSISSPLFDKKDLLFFGKQCGARMAHAYELYSLIRRIWKLNYSSITSNSEIISVTKQIAQIFEQIMFDVTTHERSDVYLSTDT